MNSFEGYGSRCNISTHNFELRSALYEVFKTFKNENDEKKQYQFEKSQIICEGFTLLQQIREKKKKTIKLNIKVGIKKQQIVFEFISHSF